jgi:hypothetical protein
MSEPAACTKPRVNPQVNYGLGVIMMCQCRFIYCTKCITLVGDIDNVGGYEHVGTEGISETSVHATQFDCEPKTALKK